MAADKNHLNVKLRGMFSVSKCLVCDSINYDISTSVTKFPSKLHYINNLKNNEKLKKLFNGNFTYELLSESYLEICVYFENLEYTEIRQEIKTTIIDLISNIGGLLGLFLGMSFLSFFEFLELFAQIIWILFHKNNSNAIFVNQINDYS